VKTSHPIAYWMLGVMLWLICSCCHGASDQHYVIKCLDFTSMKEERAGLGSVKVVAIDTKSGAEQRVDEPFRDKITMVWCLQSLLDAGSSGDSGYSDVIDVDLEGIHQVRRFMGDDARSHAFAHAVCCCPETGMKGLRCEAALALDPPGSYSPNTASFYCLCNEDGSGVVYVDGEPLLRGFAQDGSRPPEYGSWFDKDGKYFYYIAHGLAKRFNVATHKIDTLPGGDIPLVPWNGEAVIVYSRDEHMLRLLDEKNEVEAEIYWCLDGDITTVYAIDESTFLVSIRWWYSAPGSFGMDAGPLMAIHELDFHKHSARRLVKGIDVVGQILSAERVK
jgi:hypothetical protein